MASLAGGSFNPLEPTPFQISPDVLMLCFFNSDHNFSFQKKILKEKCSMVIQTLILYKRHKLRAIVLFYFLLIIKIKVKVIFKIFVAKWKMILARNVKNSC